MDEEGTQDLGKVPRHCSMQGGVARLEGERGCRYQVICSFSSRVCYYVLLPVSYIPYIMGGSCVFAVG